MAPEAKIKAANIRKLGEDMSKIAEAHLPKAKDIIQGISVGFPGFSVLGLPFHFAHERLKHQTTDNIDQAGDAMDNYQGALIKTADTWADADDKSSATITY